ncbi:ASKHA domain-containing protein [Desulfobacula phenolica]|uniref:Uncharacterized 2Fe-2 and 4Fe-4S clusters-containing protein, contains DUF4445 domain n=1 Tax=Desulfobacula phenolica TaxID=90732 RepID=A0A1H2DQ04_9BACT|nr:ASKHA domain-containing protein [Desulfobacula phenolica]SDT84939.1 Uncharacterized 2Fe-2 and 4Fe-4S clusters-containing protein, contains DUF4445 domain [Desulfobacula phenolica]
MNKYHINLLPHGRQINARSGKSMMEALMDQNIFLRSDCGGRGTCGKCRIKIIPTNDPPEFKEACKFIVTKNTDIEIPESSMLSSHIISKAPLSLPTEFKDKFKTIDKKNEYGIAADIGTTTIAMYLCNTARGKTLSSISVKNPQAIYGDDVMSRIGAIYQKKENLAYLQKIIVNAMEWGIKKLLDSLDFKDEMVSRMVVVGNPTMIHILAGVDPKSIGLSPYHPAFYDAKNICSNDLNFTLNKFSIQTLPQVSGFIGGDILGAAIAVDLENQPTGTLLVDLGTNGELMLKAKDHFFAASCATGPAFEGASLSCGMQAVPGAINQVKIKNKNDLPEYTFINPSQSFGLKPSGVCGTGVISAVAQFLQKQIISADGACKKDIHFPYVLAQKSSSANNSDIFITQKDIRSVQLGKAALITGIEFILKEAGLDKPEKIIIAGAFGTFLDKKDMMTLGMIPVMDHDKIVIAGNSAGAGAVMILCDNSLLDKAAQIANKVKVVDFNAKQDFQDVFIKKLKF